MEDKPRLHDLNVFETVTNIACDGTTNTFDFVGPSIEWF